MSDKPKETVYDEQIRPLMFQIHELARKNNIGYLAYFELDGDPGATHLTSSSANITPEANPSMTLIKMGMMLQEEWKEAERDEKGWKN